MSVTAELPNLELRAGPAALAHIREHGIAPQHVRAMAGAAGGPKWLILGELDRFVFGDWLARSDQSVDLVGASIGAWRFAAACHRDDPAAAIGALERAYVEQRYSASPDAAEITRVIADIQRQYFDDAVLDGLLNHPRWRLTVITARARGLAASERRPLQLLGSGVGAVANTLRRAWVNAGFERVLFHAPAAAPPRFADDSIATRRVALTADNARAAVYASGSIPMLMQGVRNPAGAPPGMYRDGGIVDYHIDQPLADDGLVLMPHFANRVIPGWFDKFAPWRRSRFSDRLVLVAPSRRFLAGLPNGKVPDRKDFHQYAGREAERIRDWRQCVDAGQRLAEDFRAWVASDDPARWVRPIATPRPRPE